MNKDKITWEQMVAAYNSREPIGEWYVWSMTIQAGTPLPEAPRLRPDEVCFQDGGMLIVFRVAKRA